MSSKQSRLVGEISRPQILRSQYGSFLGFQIHYDDFSKSHLDPLFTPLHNPEASKFLENEVIAALVESGVHRKADFFGVYSWKVKMKTGLGAREIFSEMEADQFQSDVYTVKFPRIEPNLWYSDSDGTPRHHLAERILRKIGYDVDLATLPTEIIVQNAFAARSEIYEAYYREMLGPAMEAMSDESDRELQELLHVPSEYPVLSSLQQRIETIFGGPFYTAHPFICERLFATWIALKGGPKRFRIHVPHERVVASLGTAQ